MSSGATYGEVYINCGARLNFACGDGCGDHSIVVVNSRYRNIPELATMPEQSLVYIVVVNS